MAVNKVPISVIIPTYRRISDLRRTLLQISRCEPLPDEIIVHVDNSDEETSEVLAVEFPSVKCITSKIRQGPGGGRNKLLHIAKNEYVASFDDDSWPLDTQFFQQAFELIDEDPLIAVISCLIIESDGDINGSTMLKPTETLIQPLMPTGGFVGCGAILRRSSFLKTSGYLPLKHAYGMEETDISLQLLSGNWKIMYAVSLRVFHACDRMSHHCDPSINAAQIRNTALLAFLRYPVTLIPFGILQVVNRVVYSLRKKRFRGVLTGICSIPSVCWYYRHFRSPVSVNTISMTRMYRRKDKSKDTKKNDTGFKP